MATRVPQRQALMWVTALAVGVGVRLAAASGRGLWIDEAFTYQVVTSGPRAAARLMLAQDYSPPLWSTICWLVVAPFRLAGMGVDGISTLIRLIAVAMFPTAVVVLVACSKRGVMSRSAALMTAWLIAVAPICVRTGSDARMYALVVPMLLLAIGTARWAVLPGGRPGWPVGAAFLLLSISHYYGLFVAAGLLIWLATVRGDADGTMLERVKARRSALLWGGCAIALVIPLLLWHFYRADAFRGSAHVVPARYLPSVWVRWVSGGLVPIWVATFVGLFGLRRSWYRGLGAPAAGIAVLLVAISGTFFEEDGLHSINPGFATVLGVCLAVSAADHLATLPTRVLAGVAAVAFAVSVAPVSGIVRDLGSMGRPGTLDLATMANAVIDDSRANSSATDGAPVVWFQDWTWSDHYIPDVIASRLGDGTTFAYLYSDDESLGALSGKPWADSDDVRIALRTGGERAAILNHATRMYFISHRIWLPHLQSGLTGCGFKVTPVRIYVIRAARPGAQRCR